ncbi:hypothetical protein [Shigella boydii]|uniref:hypothetical protein n=1 Tax=Shigella boydii TaxID=621 RepID=UPI002878301D|nr:hypothetical protein [Shigella boydii]MDS1481368.1 hypothetical protein [Shigella boydii]
MGKSVISNFISAASAANQQQWNGILIIRGAFDFAVCLFSDKQRKLRVFLFQ